jgi:hypothetical protein
MYKKYNRFYADWRDVHGDRRRKAFTTAEAATSYEEQEKRAARTVKRLGKDLLGGRG